MIKRLYVHNFRCLENFELPISGMSSALLIGRNGAGKSTVGIALEILQQIARGKNRVKDLVDPWNFSGDRSEMPMRFELEAQIEGKAYQYGVGLELPKGFKEMRVADERLSCDGLDIYSRRNAQVTLGKSTAGKEGVKFLIDWHLVALPLIQEFSQSDPLHVFKRWLAHMLILAPIPQLISGESEKDSLVPDRYVTNLGEWFTGLIGQSAAAYTGIERFVKQFMSDFVDIQNPYTGTETRRLLVQFRQVPVSLNLPFKDLSDGEKCFFICAMVLASNAAYGPLFCFWDEPENHISSAEVGHFILALRAEFENNGGQFLAASHHPEVIRQFPYDRTLLLHRLNHFYPTQVRPVSEFDVHGDLADSLVRNNFEL